MLGKVLIPLLAVVCLFPFVSSVLALLLGLVTALAVGNPYIAKTRKLTRWLLQISVIGLGAGRDLRVARALWIVPVTLVLARSTTNPEIAAGKIRSKPALPWFILGFIIAAAITMGWIA